MRMKIIALTSVVCLLFDATPTISLKWSSAHNGNELRNSSFAFPSHRTYLLANLRPNTLTDEQRDWLILLRDGHKMTEADVEQIKTPSVRRAYERAKLNGLTQAQLEPYKGLIKEEREEGKAEGIAEGKAESIAEGKAEVALKMLAEKIDDETIIKVTDLTLEELAKLKNSLQK